MHFNETFIACTKQNMHINKSSNSLHNCSLSCVAAVAVAMNCALQQGKITKSNWQPSIAYRWQKFPQISLPISFGYFVAELYVPFNSMESIEQQQQYYQRQRSTNN